MNSKIHNHTIVSIVLPTYNRAELLQKSIDSVLKQSFQEWELLVIDSGSTDNTGVLMKEIGIIDSRIKYYNVSKSNTPGISGYLNYGINNSNGEYIARLDDDDVWCNSDKLKQQVEFLCTNTDYVLVGGGVVMVDSENNVLYKFFKNEKDSDIRKRSLLACPFEHTTIMFRKDTALSIGGYRNLKVAEDWDFFLRLGMYGKFYNFREYYTNYLQGSQNLSLKDQSEVAKTEIIIIKSFREHYPGYYIGLLLHYTQYIYSFFPEFIKNRFQYLLRYIKRNCF